jgi:8-oxo-dGTP pyrophosphatase MutT (NUDIX family)
MKLRLELIIILLLIGLVLFVLKWLVQFCSAQRLARFGFGLSGTRGETESLLEMSERSSGGFSSISSNAYSKPVSKQTKAVHKAFVICFHREHGYLILYAYKAKKGRYGQLSGGGVDDGEEPADAAVREMFEETGIRIEAGRLCYFKDIDRKRFFVLELFDSDSCGNLPGYSMPSTGQNFLLKLSKEHLAFSFIKDRIRACEAIQVHSGGTCATALSQFRLDDYLSV